MNPFQNIPLFAVLANVLALVVLLAGRPRGALPWVIGLFCLGVVAWNTGVWGLFVTPDEASALPLARLTWAGLLVLPPTFLHLTVLAAERIDARRIVVTGYGVGALCIGILATPWGVHDLQHRFGAWFAAPSPLVLFYIGGFMPAAVMLSGWFLWPCFRSPQPLVRRRARTLFVIVMVMPVAALKESLHLVGLLPAPTTALGAMPWSSLAASGYGILATYAVLSDRLVRVRLFIGHRVALAMRVSFFASVMLLLLLVGDTLFAGASPALQRLLNIGAGTIAAVLCVLPFPRELDTTLARWRRRLLGESLVYQDKLRDFIERVPFMHDPEQILTETCDTMIGAYGVSSCLICLEDQTGHRWQRGWRGGAECQADPALLAWASQQLGLCLPAGWIEEPKPVAEPDTEIGFARVFPLGEKEGTARGFMALGPRETWPWQPTDTVQVRELCRHLWFQFDRMALAHTEQLRQTNAAKDRFLSSINHEMRNPLNGLKGIAAMLQAEAPSARAATLLRTLNACVDRLSATIEDVMDFANLDAGAIRLDEQPFELGAFIADTAALYNLDQDRVIPEVTLTTPLWLIGDTGKLRQILCNYLDNALKYGIGGPVRLRARGLSASSTGTQLELAVINAGITLTDANIETLFDPFERGHRARDTQAPGLGIGLSLCRRVGNAMGGRTAARTVDGQTVFSFVCTFPHASATTAASSRLPFDPPLHVLAIEDEDYNRLALGHYLEHLGVRVTWAREGKTGLRLIDGATAYDAVLMDWNLPGISGAALLEAIRERRPHPRLPVIVISAFSTLAQRDECLRAGALAFVSKPLQINSLHEALARIRSDQPASGEPPVASTRQGWQPTADQQQRLRLDALNDIREIIARWHDAPDRAVFLAHAARGKLGLLGEQDFAEQLELVENHLATAGPELEPVRQLLVEMLATTEVREP